MSLQALASRSAPHHLEIFGTFDARPEDGLGEGLVALLGPSEPGFWDHFSHQPEFSDGNRDPLDRWSARAIGGIAKSIGGTALFPFGEPARPFISWALRSGRAWQSPVVLLVHDTAGLMVSYRGAVFLPGQTSHGTTAKNPCETCGDKPCLTACPASALTGDGYDLSGCHNFLDTHSGKSCMSRGCEVRRACPVSRNHGRSEKQSAFHMERFHPCR